MDTPAAAALLILTAIFSDGGLAAKCVNPEARIIRRNNLSCANKQYILDLHNKIRNHVAAGRIDGQPKAANMVEMKWSETLAKLAQKRADTCQFDHGDLELNGERVGQNLAIVTSTANLLRLNITQMVNLWYQEVFQFGYKGGYEPNSGHYSQLIWGNTKEIGCGYTYYEEEEWFKMYFVCDYYPPGNIIKQPPYVYDKYDCKRYGLMDSRKYNKLCAVDFNDTTVCKKEHESTNMTEMNTEVTVTTEVPVEFSNETDETSTDLMTMMGEDLITDIEGNMEDLNATSSDETEDLLGSSGASNNSTDSTDESRKPVSAIDMVMALQETMMMLNNTIDDGGRIPVKNGSLVILTCNETTPIKLDWKDKDEFFKAATTLLDLLVNRQIYVSMRNV